MAPSSFLWAVVLMALPIAARAGEIPTSASEVRPLLIDAVVPDASLRAFDDRDTTLYAALGEGRAVLVFYRGGW